MPVILKTNSKNKLPTAFCARVNWVPLQVLICAGLSKFAPNICPVIKQENLKNWAISGKRKAKLMISLKGKRLTSTLQWRRSCVGLYRSRFVKLFKLNIYSMLMIWRSNIFAQPGGQRFSIYFFNIFSLTFRDRFRRGKNPFHVMCSELIGEKRYMRTIFTARGIYWTGQWKLRYCQASISG